MAVCIAEAFAVNARKSIGAGIAAFAAVVDVCFQIDADIATERFIIRTNACAVYATTSGVALRIVVAAMIYAVCFADFGRAIVIKMIISST